MRDGSAASGTPSSISHNNANSGTATHSEPTVVASGGLSSPIRLQADDYHGMDRHRAEQRQQARQRVCAAQTVALQENQRQPEHAEQSAADLARGETALASHSSKHASQQRRQPHSTDTSPGAESASPISQRHRTESAEPPTR